jgi:hypothetical protein
MGRHIYIIALTALFVVGTITDAEARNGRENQVPHGSNFGCEVCHTAAGGLNDFGFDSFSHTSGGTVDWGALSAEDSDRDGYTNGEELGDPNGTWSPGDGTPGGDFSHPGERDDGLCGNGSMEGEEECEPGSLGGATCDSLGLGSGNLSCTNDTCRYDTSGCDTCGDGAIQGGEECDGDDLSGETCQSLGLGTGTLSCTGCSYNTVGCSGNDDSTPETCGDGMLQVGEECDGSALDNQTCATLGFSGGTLGCAVRCTFDTSSCTGGASTGTNGTSGGGLSGTGGTGSENTNDAAPTGDLVVGGEKIEASGHACTTSPHRGRSTAGAMLVMLFGWVLVGVRRRG